MRNPRKVLVLFAWFSLLVVFVLASRYFYLQIVKSDHFQEKAAEQRVKEIQEPAERGKIVDRNGNVMAISLMAQDINVYPNLIRSKTHQEKVAKLLSETLEMDYEKVLKIVQSGKYWAPIAKRVDYEKVKKIKEADLGGIEFQRSPKRYYPNGDIGGSIVGFVNNENQPGAGVELSMNAYLSGTPGYTIAETDNVGNVIPVGFENISSPLDGQNVKLTIDSYIQYVLEKRLQKGMKDMEANSIHGVVMNPKTGDILGMASYPTFNPNEYGKSKPKTWTNNPAAFVYEPGSTFKPNFMANALELGTINESSSWYDGVGSINVQGSWIKNFDGRGLGQMNLEDIIVNSSNVGMIHIANSMTNEQILDGLKKIGFGSKTGIEYPGEETGLFPNASKDKNDFNSLYNDPIRKATLSFGQGLSITPVQLTTAFSMLVNGGNRVEAKLVENVTDKNGNVLYENIQEEKEKVYSDKTVSLMKSYLEANMVKGSGENYQLEGYEAGGKTGSAWVVENGRYKDGAIVGSFMGFAPLDDPEFVTLIVVDQPKGIEFGGPSAGPIWHDVMTEVLRYKSVLKKEQKDLKAKEIEVPNVSWMLYDDAKDVIEQSIENVKVTNEGNGEVVYDQKFLYKGTTLNVVLKTKKIKDKNFLYMPNVYGKSKAEIQEIFKSYKIDLKFHGVGNVTEQNLTPGRHGKQQELIFWLK